jgi:hypothetical protein
MMAIFRISVRRMESQNSFVEKVLRGGAAKGDTGSREGRD